MCLCVEENYFFGLCDYSLMRAKLNFGGCCIDVWSISIHTFFELIVYLVILKMLYITYSKTIAMAGS